MDAAGAPLGGTVACPLSLVDHQFFYDDDPTVVGMMAAGMIQHVRVPASNTALLVPFPTNISIAVSAHMIGLALPTFEQSPYWVDPSGFLTLDEWKRSHVPTDHLEWTVINPCVNSSRGATRHTILNFRCVCVLRAKIVRNMRIERAVRRSKPLSLMELIRCGHSNPSSSASLTNYLSIR